MIINWPDIKTYTGSAPYAVDQYTSSGYTTNSLTCTDIQTAVQPFGDLFWLYAVECDFVTLSNSGSVFFMNPWNSLVEMAMAVELPAVSEKPLSTENMETILYLEIGFFAVLLIVYTISSQFKKFR